jgi:UDP-glucose 4-epimerase
MGFIGMHTTRAFLDAGESVTVTQYSARREPEIFKEEIGKRVTIERVDVAQGSELLDVVRKNGVTGILHLVAPRLGALSPDAEFHLNLEGLLNVLEAGRLGGVKRVVVASSQSVYGGLSEGPFREDTPLPITSVNATETFKKTFEILISHYADRTDLDVVAVRIGGVYGPLYYSMFNLPSRYCHAAIKGVAPDFTGYPGGMPFSEDEGGDFCFVKDVARGIQLVQSADKLSHRVYNLGGGKQVKLGEIPAAVRRVIPSADAPVQEGRGPRGRSNTYLDISRARDDVGYEPKHDIQSGIAAYVEWLREHPE